MEMSANTDRPKGGTDRPKGLYYVCVIVAFGAVVYAQQRGGMPQTDKVQPVNTGANP